MDMKSIQLRYFDYTPTTIGQHEEFAVMVPFIRLEDDVAMLFEVRSDKVEQPGEICFPGGHVEEGEEPVQAAIRETVEELGLKEEADRDPSILKEFSFGAIINGPGFTLHSFLCELDRSAVEASMPDPEEVSYTFLVPMERLIGLDPEVYEERMEAVIPDDFPYEKVGIDKDYKWRTTKNDILIYEVDGYVIWGLTARVLKSVLDRLNGLDGEVYGF